VNQEIALWALGGLFTLFGAVVTAFLRVVLQQGRDTNEKVTDQGQALARLEGSSSSNANEMTRLRDNLETLRNDVSRIGGAHELADKIVTAFTEATNRRRAQRRSEDR
jgi:hypothetical protein